MNLQQGVGGAYPSGLFGESPEPLNASPLRQSAIDGSKLNDFRQVNALAFPARGRLCARSGHPTQVSFLIQSGS
jgi:hypothetical protein